MTRPKRLSTLVLAFAIAGGVASGRALAFKFDTGTDWDVNLDNSLQYTMGWRIRNVEPLIGNDLFFAQGDYKFPNRGEMVTDRIQDLIELQSVYERQAGFRVSASVWKDFAYDDQAKQNPAFSAINVYSPNGDRYTSYAHRYFVQGGEFLDAFVFANGKVGDVPVYAKLGRFTQYWGNAFFFGFSNIAYSQHSIDYIKGFSQPGSEIKELFLPRNQVMLSADLAQNLSIAGQYFLEYQPNRYPEAGTYLGFFDVLFNQPGTGALAGFGIKTPDGNVLPPNNDQNYGIKITWSPEWAHGDFGLYWRQFDEVDPWAALLNPATGHLQNTFGRKAKLWGLSYERSFGPLSSGFELNQRFDTALNSAALVPSNTGATGTLTNAIANMFLQLGTSPIWDTGILLAELTWTHLNSVTGKQNLYNGVGTSNCHLNGTAAPGGWMDGCSTRDAVAVAFLFDPQWPQALPSIDIDVPVSLTAGIVGNPAYRAGGFYAQDSKIYSIGVKATYKIRSSVELQYNGYYWRPNGIADNGLGIGLPAYAGFGGNGPVSLNDRGWIQLQFKTSF